MLSSQEHSKIARTILFPYEPTKGVLLVSIGLLAGCADMVGTTVAIDPPGQAKVKYFRDYKQTSLTGVGTREEPAALVWNVEPNIPVSIKLTSPTCTQAPGAVVDGTATYARTVTTKPGGDIAVPDQLYVAYARAFLK